jgi:hypothetical protein
MEDKETIQKINDLTKLLEELKQLITAQTLSEEWVNKDVVCSFMGYGYSQMSNILKRGDLEYVKIGRRSFISRKSLNDFLNKSYEKK